MNLHYIKRGHESREHPRIKAWVAEEMKKAGCDMILFESNNCDISAVKTGNGKKLILAAEIELTAKNALRNARRNDQYGADRILVFAINNRIRLQIERLFQQQLSAALLSKISIFVVPPLNV
jgi:hypothetical protein